MAVNLICFASERIMVVFQSSWMLILASGVVAIDDTSRERRLGSRYSEKDRRKCCGCPTMVLTLFS